MNTQKQEEMHQRNEQTKHDNLPTTKQKEQSNYLSNKYK
jgi:hypothetical protein